MNRKQYILNIVLLLLGFAATAHAQTIKGKIYGGGQLATVDGDTKVQINSGTIGGDATFDGGVFGGGLGEPTIVTGNVEVLIGKTGDDKDADGATINGDVYGGSALGNTNCTAEKIVTTEKKTIVTLNAGTINGSMYGGALGQKEDVGAGLAAIAANVYGPVQVDVNGGVVLRREADKGDDGNEGGVYSGGIYGCNNLNGSPQTTVGVDIYRHKTEKTVEDAKYTLFAVYGGGNQADYVGGTPDVTVHYCDNSIKYVYGGGNAAHLTHETEGVGDGNTNVTIWGCELIGNVFGGGNGQVQAANVSGNTSVTIHGGKIINVFGGSNTNGMIGGKTNVNVLAKGDGDDACTMKITNVYGGGNKAAGKSGTVSIACTGDGTIENVYGGANEADITGDITLNITGGKITNAFGGNNNSGRINGGINVNVDWTAGGDACAENSLTNVYGGGNQAPYYAYGYIENPDGTWKEKAVDPEAPVVYGPNVNLKNGTVSGYVYGGGLGEPAVVTGNPQVNLIGATVGTPETIANNTGGDIFGGGDAAPVIGNPLVNVNYGTVNDVFAGGRGATAVVKGNPLAHVSQFIDTETSTPLALIVNDVYGGGDAAYVDGTANVQLDKGTVRNIYGGGNAADVVNTNAVINGGEAAMAFAGGHGDKETDPQKEANVTGNAHLTIHGGSVDKAFAGSNSKGTITGDQILTIIKTDDALSELHVKEAYGGGNEADGKAGTFEIGCTGGETEGIGDLYGGARMAAITGNIAFTVSGGKIDRVFGGNNVSGDIEGSIQVNIEEDSETYDCGLDVNYVYGCGHDAAYSPTNPDAYPEVNIKNGTVHQDVFGGGLGATAIVKNNPVVNIFGGTIDEKTYDGKVLNNVFGGGSLAETKGNPTVNIKGGTVTTGVYGGGALADVSGTTNVNIINGTVGNAYGGGLGQLAAPAVGTEGEDGYVPAKENVAAAVVDANVTVSGGTTNSVFGCNNLLGGPTGEVTVTIKESANVKNVYGGGNLAAATVSPAVNIQGGTSDKVYGGGYGASAVLTGNPTVNITGGTVSNEVFGGGSLAETKGDPTVNVNGGTVTHDVYGGGALADVTGNTTVNLTGGAVGGAYGGGLGQLASDAVGTEGEDGYVPAKEAIAATITGNTTVTLGKGVGEPNQYGYYENYTATVVTGDGIFGANNQNGTPKGHVFVHVLKTAPRTGSFEYHVPAVYGGGNLSAYEPDLTKNPDEFAEVLIENCDNSIEYVYGGGNAAPVPATKVTIYGADAIDHAFAGGNGAGADNPGADVGYLNYFSTLEPAAVPYGTGKSSITVYGGIIHNVYGGSNTLGYIRGGTSVSVANKEGACPLNVGNVFGGGNQADIDCGVTINCDCSEGGTILYAGANNADVNGDITLNIHSGTFGKVFCGNNESGAVKGKLTLNVDETGCWPVMIGELYGGGNLAAYSVYGYEVDADGKTMRDADGHVVLKTSGPQLYGDPEVNLISFTRIGRVFGGGYGEHAVVYGNTHVNVNPIKGIFAGYDDTTEGRQVAPSYILNGNDERVKNEGMGTLPYGISWGTNGNIVIPNETGSIGDIFGGGNAGAVYGNTNVKIGTGTKFKTDNKVANKHLNATDDTAAEEVAVTITGNVFGGGEKAIVSGNTDVKIGEE